MANEDTLYRLEFIPQMEMDYLKADLLADDSDDLSKWTIRPPDASSTTGYVEVYPNPETAGNLLYMRYYQNMPALSTLGDTTPVPDPTLLINYAVAQGWKYRGDETKGSYFESLFTAGVKSMKKEGKRQVGQPDFIVNRGQTGFKKYFRGGGAVGTGTDSYKERYW